MRPLHLTSRTLRLVYDDVRYSRFMIFRSVQGAPCLSPLTDQSHHVCENLRRSRSSLPPALVSRWRLFGYNISRPFLQLPWKVSQHQYFIQESKYAKVHGLYTGLFSNRSFCCILQLIELLKSEDKSVVSIACYDIGEFVRFYPSGRTIVRHLG